MKISRKSSESTDPRWRDSVHYLSPSLSCSFRMHRSLQTPGCTVFGSWYRGTQGGAWKGLSITEADEPLRGQHATACSRGLCYSPVLCIFLNCGTPWLFSFPLVSSIPVNCGSSETKCWGIWSENTEAACEYKLLKTGTGTGCCRHNFCTGWGKSRFIVVSMRTIEFRLVLLLINYCILLSLRTTVNLLSPCPVCLTKEQCWSLRPSWNRHLK